MTNVSPVSTCAVLCLSVIVGAMVMYQAVGQAAPDEPSFFQASAPFQAGAPGALPMEMLRVYPTLVP